MLGAWRSFTFVCYGPFAGCFHLSERDVGLWGTTLAPTFVSPELYSRLLHDTGANVAQTISGEVQRVTFENEETHFRVVKVHVPGKGVIAAVGKFPFVGPGSHVRLTGEYGKDAKHGEQFRVTSLVVIEPDTVAGIERYLASGIIPGIGPGFAKRIVERFGAQTLAILDTEPTRLTEVPGLGTARCQDIAARWAEQRANSALSIILQTHGVGIHLVRRIVEKYGDRATEIVQTQPYRLAMDVRGIGFKTADQLAAGLGLGNEHPDRLRAGVLHCLYQICDAGHLYVPRGGLAETSSQMLQAGLPHVEAAMDVLWASGRLFIEEERVYLPQLRHAEEQVAQAFARLHHAVCNPLPHVDDAIAAFEHERGLQLADAQREAVLAAVSHQVVVITGGPGVGKTTIVRAILSVFQHANHSVALAAPTGRAAKRLTESTGNRAVTLHRLLEYEPRLNQFQRTAESPLDVDVLIVDEVSMIDIQLCQALVGALHPRTRLVLVGDADQLPSVGPGALLRDVIESREVRVVRLNAIFRQASTSYIVQNAHRILVGQAPVSCERGAEFADFFVVERKDGDKAADTIRDLFVHRIPSGFGLDPLRDVQVLCPMHRGPTGTTHLNTLLQSAVNPHGAALERKGFAFRAGDRVMQLKNDYERDVYNGDVGFVTAVDTNGMTLNVQFEGRTLVYSDSDVDALTLAYATSIHKSQGSEYPAVIIPLLTAHFVMLSRNLLYTAVTRARKLCVLVADPKAIDLALSELKREQRATTLAERLRTASRAFVQA